MASADDSRNFVLFGASGDLTQRKLLPALYHLYLAGSMPDTFSLIGYGRADLDDESFRRLAADSLARHGEGSGDPAAFLSRIHFVRGGYDDPDGLSRLCSLLESANPPIYYLALPPRAAVSVLEAFAGGLLPTAGARILMEKPFGIDYASARDLNTLLLQSFPESAVHRIDHYLAKDTVRNLLVFRFANILFEPIWNRHYVDSIQVSATETVGVENRGGYYDGIGVVRDMIQNHVLLLLAFATMEPPLADDPESIRDRIGDLLRSIDPPARRDYIYGQYEGYRDTAGVNPSSVTPTFLAAKLAIRNWRWHGVPVYIMSGKSLKARVSEVTFVFKQIPVSLLEDEIGVRNAPNVLTLRIHPNEGIRLSLAVKAPGYRDDVLPAALDFRYSELLAGTAGGEKTLFSGYERVLYDALSGRPGLSWRADAIESAWRIVEPMLDPEHGRGAGPMVYAQGSSGAVLADALLRRDNRQWYSPDF